jgi:tetratricopeptide (TPR) repeat protein
MARAEDAWDEGVRVAERFGNRRWAEQMADRSGLLFFHGEWDRALDQLEEGRPDEWRAFVLLARGDLEAADRESNQLLEDARRTGRADELGLDLALRIDVLEAQGKRAEAARLLDELIGLLPDFAPWLTQLQLVALTIIDAGQSEAVLSTLATVPPTPGAEAIRLYAAGDYAGAAARFSELSDPLTEARARLRAGAQLVTEGRPAEADVQLDKALEFFRKAGATRYIREAEQLMTGAA